MKLLQRLIFLTIIIYFLSQYFWQDPLVSQNTDSTPPDQTQTQSQPQERGPGGNSHFIPSFQEIEVGFSHELGDSAYKFVGGALIDVDNDGVDEIFVGGGANQSDALLEFQPQLQQESASQKFIDISAEYQIDTVGPTLGVISIDAENDGDVDLFVAKPSGVFLYENQGGSFTSRQLNIKIPSNAVAFSISSTDLNQDGFVDLYINTFIKAELFKAGTFNDPAHITANLFLLNDTQGSFIDISEQSGIDFQQNTFLSAFIDLDNDNFLDFVAATNTDQVKIYKNNTNGTFTDMGQFTGYGFWMGLATSDIDQDGDQDLFLTNTGNTIPGALARGDLTQEQQLDTKWALLRNDGNFKFTQVNKEYGLADYEFAWGAEFADFNLDSAEDLLVVENYIKWPLHKISKLDGRLLIHNQVSKFEPAIKKAQATNPYYGMTPLVSDFNLDGYPDIVYINLNGPVRAFLNKAGANNYLTVQLPDTASALGTKLTLETANGQLQHQQFVSSTGLLSDQSSKIFFGLGNNQQVKSLTLTWPNAKVKVYENPDINTVIQATP